jgi:tetratricopeptide (TPR) repeat protein
MSKKFIWKNAANIVSERLKVLQDKPILRYQSRKKPGTIQTNKIHEDQIRKLSDVKTSVSLQDSNKDDFLEQPNENMYKNIQTLVNKGMDKAAIMALGKLLESYPAFALAHNDLGVLYYKEGKKDEALKHYQKAAELQPENINFQKNLADFYYVERGKVQEAMEIYVKILSLNPRDIECLLMLAHISVSIEKIDDAKVFYMKVLEVDPDNADARQNLESIQKYEQGAATVKPL